MSSPATDRCRAMLSDLGRLLPVLESALIPEKLSSTAQHAAPNEDQVAAFRAERAERHMLKTSYLPETAAPADLDVVIALTDARSSLATAYSQALCLCRLPERCRRCNHTRAEHKTPRSCELCVPCPGFGATYVSPLNQRAWDGVLSHDVAVADAIEPHLGTALNAVEAALGTADEVRLLMVACPWCRGKTLAMPRGSLTLKAHVSDTNVNETFVVCHNLECPVSEDDCGSRWRGRPMWQYHELDWLNAKIDEAALQAASAA